MENTDITKRIQELEEQLAEAKEIEIEEKAQRMSADIDLEWLLQEGFEEPATPLWYHHKHHASDFDAVDIYLTPDKERCVYYWDIEHAFRGTLYESEDFNSFAEWREDYQKVMSTLEPRKIKISYAKTVEALVLPSDRSDRSDRPRDAIDDDLLYGLTPEDFKVEFVD